MRRPYRERFRLILAELGAGLAGRPEDLNDAIRRAVPALRQSSSLLAILADQNRVIARMVRDADRVVGKLADNRRDVGRFVVEAEDTASASAERAEDLQQNWRTLPGFLTELTPTMAKLEEAAREQRPVLVDLSASAGELTRFLDLSAEFSDASRPALRALADAAPRRGGGARGAAADPRAARLRRPERGSGQQPGHNARGLGRPEAGGRASSTEPRWQGLLGHSGAAPVHLHADDASRTRSTSRATWCARPCTPTSARPYADAKRAKDPDQAECRAWLGPNQPGVNEPDPSGSPGAGAPAAKRERAARRRGRPVPRARA